MIKVFDVLHVAEANDADFPILTARIACSGQLQKLPSLGKMLLNRGALRLQAIQRMWVSDFERVLAAHGFPYITAAESINARENVFTVQFSEKDSGSLARLGEELKKMLCAFSPEEPSYDLTVTGIAKIQHIVTQNGYKDIWISMVPDAYQIGYDVPGLDRYTAVWGKADQ